MTGYRPLKLQMWDAWCIESQGMAHLFHLQRSARDSDPDDTREEWIGHALSNDLLNWVELPPALGPNTSSALDDMQNWTGCTVEVDGRFLMFYTMRSSLDTPPGGRQRIGLATSDDLASWDRFDENPIISPDERWYIGEKQPLKGPGGQTVDCRDLVVIRRPTGEGWLGYYAARQPGVTLAATAVIACVESQDLIHWTHLPPVLESTGFGCLEVPDVFEIDGRWYLTCLVGNSYGNRGPLSDTNVTRGTIYAIADNPLGPFRINPEDNVLLGGGPSSGYSNRSFVFEGELLSMYVEPTLVDEDALSTPKRLVVNENGHLRLAYSPRLQSLRMSTATQPHLAPRALAPTPFWPLPSGQWSGNGSQLTGTAFEGWQVCDLQFEAEAFEAIATFKAGSSGCFGFAVRPESGRENSDGDVVLGLDLTRGSCFAAVLPEFTPLAQRVFHTAVRTQIVLRIIVRATRYELYVDDELVLQFAHVTPIDKRGLGLYVENCSVAVGDVEVFRL